MVVCMYNTIPQVALIGWWYNTKNQKGLSRIIYCFMHQRGDATTRPQTPSHQKVYSLFLNRHHPNVEQEHS